MGAFGKVLAAAALLLSSAGAAGPAAREQRSAAVPPPFQGASSRIDAPTREQMTGSSWHRGCPVGLGDLRLLRLSYWGFDDRAHTGRLVVNEAVASDVLKAMHALYHDRFPIRRMHLVDAYGADDHRSMAADNTSAFNCRFINGQPGVWSQHAFGKAIDVDPVENPYVTGSGFVSPPVGKRFADRSSDAPGVIHRGDVTVRAFRAVGWDWGGSWSWPKDFQHFSANGH